MKVLIAGGSGYLGRHLARTFLQDNHEVSILTRGAEGVAGTKLIPWDGRSIQGWGQTIEEMDLVIHLAGKSLGTWPWTKARKQEFETSRVESGRVLVKAIQQARHRPRLFVQQSGINYYGLRGDPADESSQAAGDFLAQLTVRWEAATHLLEDLGIRRVVLRSAVVLSKGEGLMPLISLPVKLFMGGPLGNGRQVFPWIHLEDWISAVKYLVYNEQAQGAYNLIAPVATSNEEFNRALALVLHRPFWFPTPGLFLRCLLGEMSNLILEGRAVNPKRLMDGGFQFHFPHVRDALINIFGI